MSMTPKERVIAQIKHKKTDYLPYVVRFERDYDIEARVDAYYGSNHWQDLLENHIARIRVISDKFWTLKSNNPEKWTDLFGTTWRMNPRPRQPIEPALKEPSLEEYEFPSIDDCFDAGWEELAEGEINANQDRFTIAYLGNGLFERSWMMRGYEKALMDIALYRDFYEELVENIKHLQMQMLERILQLPVDGIFFTDDWGYQHGVMVGAKRWREIFKPRYAQMFKQVHEAGKYNQPIESLRAASKKYVDKRGNEIDFHRLYGLYNTALFRGDITREADGFYRHYRGKITKISEMKL